MSADAQATCFAGNSHCVMIAVLQALQAAVGEQVAGGVLVGGEGGRPVYWDSPQATPDGVSLFL